MPLDTRAVAGAKLIAETPWGGIMSDYRLVAQRCVQLAIKAKDQGHRGVLLDLAGEWLELADNDASTAMLMAEIEALKRAATISP